MTNGNPPDWNDRDKKRAAILKVLRHIIAHRQEGQDAADDDQKAHNLFETIGQIQMPPGARAIIFPPGEKASQAASSVIIEMPPPEVTPESNPSDDELLKYVLGNYQYW